MKKALLIVLLTILLSSSASAAKIKCNDDGSISILGLSKEGKFEVEFEGGGYEEEEWEAEYEEEDIEETENFIQNS